MAAKASRSDTVRQPSLQAGLENLHPKRSETRQSYLGRLGIVAARFPTEVITPEKFCLLKPHLEDWSFAMRTGGGRKWVVGERPVDEALVNTIELGTFSDGQRRRIGPKNGSIMMLIEEALLGDDVKAAIDIEQIVSPGTPMFVPTFHGQDTAAVIRYEAYLNSSRIQQDVQLLEQWLRENPYTPGEPGQES